MPPETEIIQSTHTESETGAETNPAQDRLTYTITLTRPCAEWVATVATDATGPRLTATAISTEDDSQLTLQVIGDGFMMPAWKHEVETTITDVVKQSSCSSSLGDASTNSPTAQERK